LRLDGGPGIFGFDFFAKGGEFGGGTRDEEKVETFLCELDGIFFANSVGGAGYYCPCAFLAIGSKLFLLLAYCNHKCGIEVSYILPAQYKKTEQHANIVEDLAANEQETNCAENDQRSIWNIVRHSLNERRHLAELVRGCYQALVK
jgi:hypothetical protein